MNHPGRLFIRDAVAAKAWLWPLRIVKGRRFTDLKIVDGRNETVARFKRWRYAYLAYDYLTRAMGCDPLSEHDAEMVMYVDSRERQALTRKARAQRLNRLDAKRRGKIEAARLERKKRGDKFWSRVGGRPKDLHTG